MASAPRRPVCLTRKQPTGVKSGCTQRAKHRLKHSCLKLCQPSLGARRSHGVCVIDGPCDMQSMGRMEMGAKAGEAPRRGWMTREAWAGGKTGDKEGWICNLWGGWSMRGPRQGHGVPDMGRLDMGRGGGGVWRPAHARERCRERDREANKCKCRDRDWARGTSSQQGPPTSQRAGRLTLLKPRLRTAAAVCFGARQWKRARAHCVQSGSHRGWELVTGERLSE